MPDGRKRRKKTFITMLKTDLNFALLIKRPIVSVLLFFLVFLIIGLSAYKDYGVSLDEPSQGTIALVTAKYLLSVLSPGQDFPQFSKVPSLADYDNKEYGVIFELPIFLAQGFFIKDFSGAEPFYLRHLCTFLLFYISVFFFFLIVKDRFETGSWGSSDVSA